MRPSPTLEKLDAQRREKLLDLVERLWDRSADGLELTKSDAGAYGEYWHARLGRFMTAYIQRAREALSTEQIQRLQQLYEQKHEAQPDNAARSDDGSRQS